MSQAVIHRMRGLLTAMLVATLTGCSLSQDHTRRGDRLRRHAHVQDHFRNANAAVQREALNAANAPARPSVSSPTADRQMQRDGVPEKMISAVSYSASSSEGQPEAKPASATPAVDNAAPRVDTTKLTLDQVINTVLIADPTIRAGLESINQANGDALTASLKPNPNFSIAQTLLPLTRPFTVDEQGGPPQLDVGLAYPIDWFLFGKRAAAMQAAGLGVRVSEAEYAELIRQRVLQAATAYYDVLEAKALLDLARQDAANFKRVEEITQKAVEGGGRPQVELGRIRLDRLRAEQSVRDANYELVAAKARLRALMGYADLDPNFDLSGSLEEIGTPELPALEESYAIAMQNRPDIEALRRRVAQANAQVVSEQRQAYPEVAPQIGYTRQFQQKAIGFPDADSFGFGLEMSLPIFNRNQGNRYRAASVAVQQQFALQAGLVELRAEVVQADQDLRTAQANAKAVAEEQLKLAEEVRDSLNRAYEAGGRPLIDVLDAQRNYRETYRLFIESRANLGRAGVRFNAVLGQKVTP